MRSRIAEQPYRSVEDCPVGGTCDIVVPSGDVDLSPEMIRGNAKRRLIPMGPRGLAQDAVRSMPPLLPGLTCVATARAPFVGLITTRIALFGSDGFG